MMRLAKRCFVCAAVAMLALFAPSPKAQVLTQNFDAVAERPSVASGPLNMCPQHPNFLASGWSVVNQSDGAGIAMPSTRCVTQGFPDIPFVYDPALSFWSQDGLAFAYAGFPSRAASTPSRAASLWMISPRVDFGAGASLEFWTRRVNDGNVGADRMQVRVMLGPGGPEVGNPGDSAAVGGFTNLLLDINPTGSSANYICPGVVTDPIGRVMSNFPFQDWCRVRLTSASGLPNSGSGYIAFRYYSPAVFSAPFPHVAAIDTFVFDPGLVNNLPPTLSYGTAPGGVLAATGDLQVGSTAEFRLPIAIDSPGAGSGSGTTTTLRCNPLSPPFSGFSSVITAQPGFVLSMPALIGSCVRSSGETTRGLQCTETRGGQAPIAIDYLLRCPTGVGAQAYQRYAAAVRADDPALYWRLGELEGGALNSANGPDSIGPLGNGTLNGPSDYGRDPVPMVGAAGNTAFGFHPNSSERVTSGVFDKLGAGSDGMTLEAWVRFDGAVSGFVNIVGDRPNDLGNSFAFLYLLPTQQLRLHVFTQHGLFAIDTADAPLEPGMPYHVVATWSSSSGQMRLHVNGREATTTVNAGGNPTTGLGTNSALNPIMIGSDLFETLVGAAVTIDEVAVYRHVLADGRIRLHYELGSLLADGFGD